MKNLKLISFVCLMVFAFASCSKKRSTTPPTTKKSVKIVLTFTSINLTDDGDDFDGLINGGNGTEANYWNINGATQPYQTIVSFSKADIVNNTITIESTNDVGNLNFDVSGFANTGSSEYKLVISTTINGNALAPVTINANNNPYSKDFNY